MIGRRRTAAMRRVRDTVRPTTVRRQPLAHRVVPARTRSSTVETVDSSTYRPTYRNSSPNCTHICSIVLRCINFQFCYVFVFFSMAFYRCAIKDYLLTVEFHSLNYRYLSKSGQPKFLNPNRHPNPRISAKLSGPLEYQPLQLSRF